MIDDLETLKIIKEKEQSINQEISLLKGEKEKQLQQLESGFSLKLKENEEKLSLWMKEEVDKVRARAEERGSEIRETSRVKTRRLKLKLSDKEIEEIAKQVFDDYLGGI